MVAPSRILNIITASVEYQHLVEAFRNLTTAANQSEVDRAMMAIIRLATPLIEEHCRKMNEPSVVFARAYAGLPATPVPLAVLYMDVFDAIKTMAMTAASDVNLTERARASNMV